MKQSLLTIKEARSFLKISSSTIYRYSRRGLLPHYKTRFGIRFQREEIENWLDKYKRKAVLFDNLLKNALTNSPPIVIDKAKGGQKVARKKTRHNYGYGSVYVRKTKKGIPRYYIEYYNKSKKRIQQLVKNVTNWNAAQEALKDAVYKVHFQELEVRTYKQQIKFKEFAQIYLKDYSMIQKKSWERSDKVYLNASLIPYFGRYEIRRITSHLIEQFIRMRFEKGVQKSSINRDLSCLSKMFGKAIDWGYLSENPMMRIKRFSEKDNMRERVLSEEEEERLVQHSSEHLKPIILTALNTGMRLGEILRLKWSQIDLKTRRIQVENTKSGKNRIIEINQNLYDVLRQRNNQLPYVFPNPDTGKPLTTVKRTFKTACKRAGIENLRFHDLRHTVGTRLSRSGVDIETVRDLMGHHSIVVTQRYLHTNEQRRRNAVESLTKKNEKGTEKGTICYTDCYTGTKSGKQKKKESPLNVLFSVN